ncbi:hypothetical protein [uncultured Roseobacter sp.]|uniref:hypothetical protein n=1 Tax=uncultured Roseobacter sp. TaxID=114847 RepID=UPI00263451AD|nr:hypothetical protein [uncultured Roseobacter sp.]
MVFEIKPEIMEAILQTRNWEMATALQDRVLAPGILFPAPKPQPRPALVVPVDVQGLYVPVSHSERYVRLPMVLGAEDSAGGDTVVPFSTPRARKRGVHLHWAMPDGLLRGAMVEDDDAPIEMPPLPDRWLVTRMTGRTGQPKLDLRSWVIEAESGHVFDLENYPGDPVLKQDKSVASDDLTGVVGGSPNWTASYDATLNRFAFHDPLEDLNPQQIFTRTATYVITGWWSERSHDPLSAVFSPYSVKREISELGWTASSAPVPSKWVSPVLRYAQPRDDTGDGVFSINLESQLRLTTSQASLQNGFSEYRFDKVTVPAFRASYETVMHGVVYGVPVAGAVRSDTAPAASKIALSMAPTLERLMAAQAARGMGVTSRQRKEYVESLLTAVSNGALMRVDERDGIVQLDEAEHADGFEAFQGPETYLDVIVERHQSALRAGRPQRNKAARKTSRPPASAEMIWSGRGRGGTKNSRDQMRRTAEDQILRKSKAERFDDRPATKTIRRPGPRYHRATAPVVGLRNYGRSQRFLGDGRFEEDGTLVCRWTEELATGFEDIIQASDYVPALSHDALPDVTNRVLLNSFLHDIYLWNWTSSAMQANIEPELLEPARNRLSGEMALRFSPDGVYDGVTPIARAAGTDNFHADAKTLSAGTRATISDEIRRFSLADGRDPSPVAITSWSQPWCPVWLEWEVVLEPGSGFAGWTLGRMDFAGAPQPQGKSLTLRGRSPITSGLSRTYQAAIDTFLIAENQRDEAGDGEIGEGHETALADLAAFLQSTDLGSVTLDQISDVWLALENGPDGQVEPVPEAAANALREAGLPRLIADGTLELTRARIVDTFGRFRDVNPSRVTLPAALESKTTDGARALALPPRLTLPSRLMWRFTDPADSSDAPREAQLDQSRADRMVNPISGYVLPDFMDEAIEFFDQTGAPMGEVLHDPVTGGLIWEGAVGAAGPASATPHESAVASAGLSAHIAQGMIDADIAQRNDPDTAGAESPLSAFLRAVDTTMWSVDSGLTSSGASIAGLVGRPIAVVRTQLWIDIPDDLAATGAYGEEADDIRDLLMREAVYDAVKSAEFRVRLGELAKGHDGLYGFFIGDDYSLFHLIEKEVSSQARLSQAGFGFRALLGQITGQTDGNSLPSPSPLNAPYISAGEPLAVHVGQKLKITLLMHPTARVHATTGFLPRKSLELLRDWVDPGLSRIAPSARIGPVLIDPDKVRLPKIAAFGSDQTWVRRNSAITWREDPILSATQAAVLPTGRVTVEEGYIRINPNPSHQEEDS